MKRFVTIALLLVMASLAWGQNTMKVINWAATGNGSTAIMTQNAGYGFHVVTWTKSGTVSACTFAIQSSTTYGGSYTTLGATSDCSSAGSYTYYGTANFVKLNVSSWTGTGTITFTYKALPAGMPFLSGISCGSSATCASPTAVTAPMKFATGTVAMSSATSVNVSGISPAFSSATSFACVASNANGHAYTSGVEITSSSAITLVSGTSNSDTWIWYCIGS